MGHDAKESCPIKLISGHPPRPIHPLAHYVWPPQFAAVRHLAPPIHSQKSAQEPTQSDRDNN
eukprot:m.290147 g.290147  ORF g.290147 m.290147 type:complete len:62 (-) comp27120_c0_seq4:90-275(-)